MTEIKPAINQTFEWGLTQSYEGDPTTVELYQQLAASGYRYHYSGRFSWTTEATDPEPHKIPGVQRVHHRSTGSWSVLLAQPNVWMASLERNHIMISCTIHAKTHEALQDAEQGLRTLFPEIEEDPERPDIPVTFWMEGPQGPISINRRIDAPLWSEVSPNYPQSIQESLENLVNYTPDTSGKIILWTGVPGTGKTWALRAIAREWRKWCRIHYIVDPEKFYGTNSAYLLQVLVSGESDEVVMDVSPNGEAERAPTKPWRLLVLEDTGELLSADARERSGQGLSRLLNVSDGLVGQGLRVLTLITTNEELRSFHPAITRPGRCASLIKFKAFSQIEANRWLKNQGSEVRFTRSSPTLADLYAAKENWAEIPSDEKVGFSKELS